MQPADSDDPKGLIREAYRIDGITGTECRSILIDWALSLPATTEPAAAARRLAGRAHPAGHPMTALLVAAAEEASAPPVRRGGRAARVGG